jgi:hypothetical protein
MLDLVEAHPLEPAREMAQSKAQKAEALCASGGVAQLCPSVDLSHRSTRQPWRLLAHQQHYAERARADCRGGSKDFSS